jgi:hypothetical protein
MSSPFWVNHGPPPPSDASALECHLAITSDQDFHDPTTHLGLDEGVDYSLFPEPANTLPRQRAKLAAS